MGRDVGVVLPILSRHASRIFDNQKSVFVKYLPRAPRKLADFRLKIGMKVLFYVTKSGRSLAGEAKIANIEFLSPKEATRRYQDKMILSQAEVTAYLSMQPRRDTAKPLMVLSLTNTEKYPAGIVYPRNISMVGEYIDEATYRNLPHLPESVWGA